MRVSVIGQGYVGLTLAIAAAEAGHSVVGFDVDINTVEKLKKGITHVPGLDQGNLRDLISNEFYFPTSDPKLISNSQIVIIAVPTPLNEIRKPDLTYLHSAIKILAKNLAHPTLIINESTSFPGTLRNVIKVELEKISKVEFRYASAPERVDPANSDWNIHSTPRVIAGLDDKATDQAIDFYRSFCNSVYRATSCEVAEASKIFENTFRQINIALANEFSEIADALGFSASEAILAASTKPFGFMPFYPSIGVGGHCIPIDPSYLSYISEKVGIKAKFIDLANETNLLRPNKVASKIATLFDEPLCGKKIQVVGIAYKPNVEDLRESPALELIHELRKLDFTVIWHDPFVKKFKGELSSPLDPEVDLGLIVTPHEGIDYSIWKREGNKVLDLSPNSSNYGWPKFL
jgi:UDP-N-acetyl-D-glucosamine dehydrogenase